MSCTIEKSSLLHCISPDHSREITALNVYFNSISGKERLLVTCARLDRFECDDEHGFISSLTRPSLVDITFPRNFSTESGYFRCQIKDLIQSHIGRCDWAPPENDTYFKEEDHLGIKDSTPGVNVAVVAGLLTTFTVIIIMIVVGCFMLRMFRSKTGLKRTKECRVESNTSCMEKDKNSSCCIHVPTENECARTSQENSGSPLLLIGSTDK